MLDIEDQPRHAQQSAKDGLLTAQDNPWDRSSIEPVLTALANSLSDRGHGEYHNNNLELSSHNQQTKPIIDYAPALILRKSIYLILDGQQRLTFLYQAFYGKGEHNFLLT